MDSPASLRDWIGFVLPDNSGQLWQALGVVAAGLIAYFAYRISRLQLFIQSTPIIILSRSDGKTVAENVGRGVALMISACGEDGDIADEFASLREGEKREIRLAPAISASNSIYYKGSTGRWFRSKVTGRSHSG